MKLAGISLMMIGFAISVASTIFISNAVENIDVIGYAVLFLAALTSSFIGLGIFVKGFVDAA